MLGTGVWYWGSQTPIGIEPMQSHSHEGIEPSAPTTQVQYQLTELAHQLGPYILYKPSVGPRAWGLVGTRALCP